MALQIVKYSNCSRLSCAGCSVADVILCVPEAKVEEPDCPTGMTSGNADKETVERGYVYATLIDFYRIKDSCGNYRYHYTFQYDDAQLIPDTLLTATDISGVVCEGCLTDWVKDLVGNEVTVAEDTPGYITVTNQHGCEFTFQRGWTTITQDEQNGDVTVTYPDGTSELFPLVGCSEVQDCETDITANNTDSIDITASGQSNHTIEADLNVDPAGNNLLSVSAAGVLASVAVTQGVTGDGTVGNELDVLPDPAAENMLTVGAAGVLVDLFTGNGLTGDGNAATPLNLVPDPDGNNMLTISGAGIFVDGTQVPSFETPITNTPANGVNVTLGGTSDHNITVAPVLDPAAANMLTVGAAGLLVDLFTGNGLTGDGNAATQLDLVVDPNPSNITSVGAAGILTLETTFAAVNGNGITVTAGGTAGHTPTITARVDAAAGNDATMVPGATGGVRVEVGVGTISGVPSQPVENQAINAVATYTGTASGLASVTNNHLTANMLVQGTMNWNVSGNFKAGMVYNYELEIDEDGGGFAVFASAIHVNPVDLPSGGVPPGSQQIHDADNIIAPGVTFTRRSRIIMDVTTLPDTTGTWEESVNTIRLIGWALKGF